MSFDTTQNRIPNDLELADLLDLHSKEIFLNFNSHHIGTVQSFDVSNQTATATINYKKQFYQLNQQSGNYEPVLLDYPLLADCPVVVLGGGSGALTFPIQQGDECLVLFNDRDIDLWFHSGGGAAPNSSRLHSFADGIILVGIRSLGNVLSGYDTSHALIRAKTGKVGVNASNGKALISNSGTSLGVALQAFCTACEGSSDPTLASAATALSSALNGILE